MNKQTSLLKGVCLLGLVVFIILLGTLIFVSINGGIPFFSSIRFGKSAFTQALDAYDQQNKDGLSFRQHNSLLDALEKKAFDIESTLSVLKRRRHQALRAPSDREQYLASYTQAAAKARKQYPHSAQIGAIAAETLVLNGLSGKGETAAELQEIAALMTEGSLANLALAFSVYAGSMGDPAQARLLRRELFTLLCSLVEGEEREKYLVNSCIRTILEDNPTEAFAMVNALFAETPLLDETILFGAEFFYDYRNFFRSAELFSLFTDSWSLGRQADAQWLAGFVESARGLWQIAAVDTNTTANNRLSGGIDLPSIKARSFYNLASTTSDNREAERYLEQLFAANSEYEQGEVFGIIRYSRLVPTDRALAILSQTDYEREGLFDLELLRRRSEDWEIDKTVAETWMLLGRNNNDGRLYEWAVWFFDFQHRYEETARALRDAGRNRAEGPWSALHRAYALIRQREYAEAEKMLRSIVRSPQETKTAPGRFAQPLWQAGADLGMLLEKQNNFQEALQYYEIAAAQLTGLIARPSAALGQLPNEEQGIPAAGVSLERRDAAKIQLRIASVLRALGKTPESVRALDYALDLDPENMEARLEKRRLDSERGFL